METMIFKGVFKKALEEAPVLPDGELTVDVWFIVDGVLHRGNYHMNKQYRGEFAFASATGRFDSWGERNKQNKVCTHWCYIHEFAIEECPVYTVVTWPQVQELLDKEWFDDEAVLINDDNGIATYGSSAYFVPLKRLI